MPERILEVDIGWVTPDGAIVGVFEDKQRANRTYRLLRRSGLHPSIEHVGRAFEVLVPFGSEEQKAHRVLQSLQQAAERPGRTQAGPRRERGNSMKS